MRRSQWIRWVDGACLAALTTVVGSAQNPPPPGTETSWSRPASWTPDAVSRRMRAQWSWLKIGGELRGRVETPAALNFVEGNDDSYLLARLRLNLQITARPWLTFFSEVQDVRAFGKDVPIPGSMANRIDLRQAYVQVGAIEEGRWGFRLGRQALKYGRGRLVWDPDWGNFGQTFDAIRFTLATRGARVDAFASSVVVPTDRAFDRPLTGNMLYGAYGAVDGWGAALRIEPYILLKSSAAIRNELGKTGTLDIYTGGFRALGKWRALDWETEMALQGGSLAGNAVQAFGGVWVLGLETGTRRSQPRISATYTYGSGDTNSLDGRKGTFDTLYPSTHLRNGATDRVGWANIRDIAVQSDWKLSRAWKISAGGHDFRLATLQDALYSSSGTATVRNPRASSSHVGWELFGSIEYQLLRTVVAGAGYAQLFKGPFLHDCVKIGVRQPYLYLSYRF